MLKKLISFVRHSHPEIYKVILVLLAVSIIVYIFPKQGKFKYEFQSLKGKPWYHEDLIAPFDFAIKKNNDELAAERAGIIKDSKPYFRLLPGIFNEKKTDFEKNFEKTWTKKIQRQKEESKNLGIRILDSLYSKGIIENSTVIENKPGDFSIFLLHTNIAEEHELKEYFSIQQADDYVKKQLEAHSASADITLLLPLLENSLAYSIVYDKTTSDKILKQSLDDISPTHDLILKDQSIISKGEIIDAQKFQVLESLKAEYEGQSASTGSYLFILLGQVILVFLCISVLASFLAFFRKDIFQNNAKLTLILILIVLQVLMGSFAVNTQAFSIYLLPFCILPVIVRAFYDTRVALFVHVVSVLIIAFMAPNRFEFAFIQLLGGMVTIFSIVNLRNRSQIFISSALIFITYSVAYTGITIIQEGGNDVITGLDYAWFGLSALLTLFSYPLIFVFEKLFGFTSDVSLLELSDTNGKLLRELAARAPGTFQHSLQVANLAEEAIYAIGGNSLLVRTGALYHDIGKMEMPLYFIENQTTGINPHQDLSFDESATIIISHVLIGIEIAKKNKLPEQIIDFIRTHHGTSVTGFFYRSAVNSAFPDEQVDESKFHYPGPIPFSKETAVLMMADSVEAASRSLKKYDMESINNLVEHIINTQIEQNQYANSDITFRDINRLKKIFKKKLMNIYHVRIEYPR